MFLISVGGVSYIQLLLSGDSNIMRTGNHLAAFEHGGKEGGTSHPL